MKICDRCSKIAQPSSGSIFTSQRICLACVDEEKAHPLAQTAIDAQWNAIYITHDSAFPGIGLPSDIHFKYNSPIEASCDPRLSPLF